MENKINFDKGSVWIVGAGPGDPGLLTVLAVKAIRNADVIFYDALINSEVLHLAKPIAKLVYVGKKAKKHFFKYFFIYDVPMHSKHVL